ncbi:hypothetical protein HYT32_02280 [Candidatus Roizmanbacteria bacterium]|nr:hypothetical protein [Candidatus Roizmanbacteria bacterium]
MVNAERIIPAGVRHEKLSRPIDEITLEDETILQGFQITQEFLRRAESEKVFEKFINSDMRSTYKPEDKQEKRRRNLKILIAFANNPEMSEEKVGEKYGMKHRQRVSQVIRETLEKLWKHSYPSLQKQFPLDVIMRQRKPARVKTRMN